MHTHHFSTAAAVIEHGLQIAGQYDDNSLEAGIRRNELRLALAQCKQLDDRMDEAVPAYRACVQENPGSLDAWIGLGECEYERDNISTAKQAFSRALTLDPESEAALVGWQKCRIRRGM